MYYVGAAADSGISVIKCRLRSCTDVRGTRTNWAVSRAAVFWRIFAAAADVARKMACEDIAPTQGRYEDVIGNKHDARNAG